MARDRSTRNSRVPPSRKDQFELVRRLNLVRYLHLCTGGANFIDVAWGCWLIGAALKPCDIPLSRLDGGASLVHEKQYTR